MEYLVRLIDACTSITSLSRGQEPATLAKYPDRTLGQCEALENILGTEVVVGLLSGKLTVRVVGNEVVIEPTKTLIFDKNGRRIPPEKLDANTCDANYVYAPTRVRLAKPDFAARAALACEALPDAHDWIPPDEFYERIVALVAKIKEDVTISRVLKGAWYPVCIPGGLGITAENYGEKIDTVLVPAVKTMYERAYPGRTFNNNLHGQLAGEVGIWRGSRHEQLIEEASKGPVVGIYFPTALQGYSINADREQMASLPEMFLLAGALDSLAAQMMYAKELLRDFNVPWYDMAAMTWRGFSLGGNARDFRANFLFLDDLAYAREHFAGGAFVPA